MIDENIKIAGILCLVSLLFIIFGHYYPNEVQGVLKRPLFTLPAVSVDWWSISHFFFYAILSYLFPNYLMEILVISILWEIIEDGLSDAKNTQLVDCDKKNKNWFSLFWCNIFSRPGGYWYAKWDDVFFNSLGIIFGHYLKVKGFF
jgi:hypothetical protein